MEEGEQQVTEYKEDEESIQRKVKQLAEWIWNAEHFVAYTGAGISTSAGIPDNRGDKGLDVVTTNDIGGPTGWRKAILGMGVGQGKADTYMPSFAHIALAELIRKGLLKFIVTSNHDNFHIQAGTPPENIAEIFGNGYVEKCVKCHKEYRRHVQVPQLGRICDDEACKGSLKKCGVRYNSMIPQEPLDRAVKNSKKADVALVLGSSMTVTPFCDMPFYKKGNKTAICTLQDTSYDKYATLKINATCDDLMKRLLNELGIEVTSYTYTQKYIIRHKKKDDTAPSVMKWQLTLEGGYPNEPCTCVGEVIVTGVPKDRQKEYEMEQERLVSYLDFEYYPDKHQAETGNSTLTLHLVIKYREEYGEPPLEYDYVIDPAILSGFKEFEFSKTLYFNQ